LNLAEPSILHALRGFRPGSASRLATGGGRRGRRGHGRPADRCFRA